MVIPTSPILEGEHESEAYAVSLLIAMIVEFFAFSVDYSRTEYTQFEDDEYYYYVKAVPKACVTTSERSIKKINGSSAKDERPAQDNVVSYA